MILKDNLKAIEGAADSARQAATHAEAKAENKYDTRGLESAYLAGAQAARAQDMSNAIARLRSIAWTKSEANKSSEKIALLSLVQVYIDGKVSKWFFLLPVAGGITFESCGLMIQTLTPESPLGKKLLNKQANESFELNLLGKIQEFEIETVA